jgi:transcriptional regulator with XRE-family HTH domain
MNKKAFGGYPIEIFDSSSFAELIKERLQFLIVEFAEGSAVNFSKLVGINYQSLNNWIKKNNSIPSAERLGTICTALNIRTDWLLLGKGTLHIEEEIIFPNLKDLLVKLSELNPTFFEASLVEFFKKAYLKKIDERTEKKADQLKPVIDTIMALFSQWSEYCAKWASKIIAFQSQMNHTEQIDAYKRMCTPDGYLNFLGDGEDQLEADRKGYNKIKKVIDSIGSLRSEMNKCESEIDVLLKVFKEDDNGDSS